MLICLVFIALSFPCFSQSTPEITVTILGNEKIADVNIDQEKFVNNVGQAIAILKTELSTISKDQKIMILLTSHKIGAPTINIYSSPALNTTIEKKCVDKLNAIKFVNTKIIDFPILLNINNAEGHLNNAFKDIVLPIANSKDVYEKSDLKKMYELNKTWAAAEVLPILCAYEKDVDEKFAGVKNVGILVSKTNFTDAQNTKQLTNTNPYYWRAVLEMNLGNQLIPATKIFMHVANGEFDYALKYLEMVLSFSDPKSIPNDYLKELSIRLKIFNQNLNALIKVGIKEHDKGNFENAITQYKTILNDYPNSAWAMYEMYYSKNRQDIENKKIELEDRSNWDKAKINIYATDPLYDMDVRASSAKEGYLLFRRQEIRALFKNKEDKLNDVFKYADIALDLEVYDFAAQLYWLTFTNGNEKALIKFLYCMEKLGVTNLKENFKGDFVEEFKKLEAEKDTEMKNSAIYKAFK